MSTELSKPSTAFSHEILLLLRKHYPGVFRGDKEQVTSASGDLALALGGLLAIVKVKSNAATWEAVVRIVMAIIKDNQDKIIIGADEELRRRQ